MGRGREDRSRRWGLTLRPPSPTRPPFRLRPPSAAQRGDSLPPTNLRRARTCFGERLVPGKGDGDARSSRCACVSVFYWLPVRRRLRVSPPRVHRGSRANPVGSIRIEHDRDAVTHGDRVGNGIEVRSRGEGGQALISWATRSPCSAACSCPSFSDSSASPRSDAISGFQNAWVSSASATCTSRPKASARILRR